MSMQVNLLVFTGKLHVTQVNCVWGLFTCELQVKLAAFACNFARVSFRVKDRMLRPSLFWQCNSISSWNNDHYIYGQ